TASRRQCRLTQAGRADTIIDKVHLHFRDFLDADQAICVKILLFGFSVPEGKVAVQGMTMTVDNSAGYLLQRAAHVDDNATIRAGVDLLQYGTSILHGYFGNLGNIRTVREVYAKAL